MRKTMLAMLGAVLAVTAGAVGAVELPKSREWAFPQAFIMQKAYGSLASCAKYQDLYDAHGWPHGKSLQTLVELDRRVKTSVFLRPDNGADTWTPLASVLLQEKRKPAADCDDVSITSAEMAVCAGFEARNLGVMITQFPGRAREMHMVAFYNEPGAGMWVFGDTMGRPRPFEQLNQKLHYYAYLGDLTKWWALIDPLTGEALTQSLPISSLPLPGETLDTVSGSCHNGHKG